MTATDAERVAAVADWFAQHHPQVRQDLAVWHRAVNHTATAADIAAALDRWAQLHDDPPTAADCNAQLRQIARNRAAGTHIARARQQIAEAIARRDAERPHTRPRQPLGGTR